MADSRAAEYIAYGMNRGVEHFLNAMEKRKERDRQEANDFKSYVALLDSAGIMSKDKALTLDLPTAKGVFEGYVLKNKMEEAHQKAALQQATAYNKLAQDQAIAGYGEALGNNVAMGYSPGLSNYYENSDQGIQRPPFDYSASVSDALTRNPMAAADERFGAVNSTFQHLQPKEYAPTDNYRMLMEIDKLKAGGNADAAAKLEEERQARMHPTGQDRFDLPYSQQMLMQNELNALHASYANPDFRPAFIKEAEKAKLKPDQLYLQKLNAIEGKYKDRLRKAVQSATATPPAPEKSEPKKISTKAEFDALPSGALFVNPSDGAIYKKK